MPTECFWFCWFSCCRCSYLWPCWRRHRWIRRISFINIGGNSYKERFIRSINFFTIALMYLIFDYNFGMISMSIFCGVSLIISNLGRKFLYLQSILFISYGLLLFIKFKHVVSICNFVRNCISYPDSLF